MSIGRIIRNLTRRNAKTTCRQKYRRQFQVESLEQRQMMTGMPELLLESGPAFAQGYTQVGEIVYYAADDGAQDGRPGLELWKTDGTPDGTTKVEVAEGHQAPVVDPDTLTYVPFLPGDGGTLYLSANDGVHGMEPWWINAEGKLELAADVAPGSVSSNPRDFTPVLGIADDEEFTPNNMDLFFAASNSQGLRSQLWAFSDPVKADQLTPVFMRSDGAKEPINDPRNMQSGLGVLVFSGSFSKDGNATSGVFSAEARDVMPYSPEANGNAVETYIAPGSSVLAFDKVTISGSGTYFTGAFPAVGAPPEHLLYRLANPPVRVGDLNPSAMIDVDGDLFLADGRNLYTIPKTNPDSPYMLPQLTLVANSTQLGTTPENLTNVGGKLYFTAAKVGQGFGTTTVWKVDENGARAIEGFEGGVPRQLTELNGTLFFNTNSGLWQSTSQPDGSDQTQRISTLGIPTPDPSNLFGRYRGITIAAGPNGVLFMTGGAQTYVVATQDFGDAPNAVSDAPRHQVNDQLYLGQTVDEDTGPMPSANALGDDSNGTDDEDGLVDSNDLNLSVGERPVIQMSFTNTAGQGAKLYGWIDYDSDGQFEVSERAVVDVPTQIGQTVELVFPVVPNGFTGQTFARFRLSTDPAAANPGGYASDGEVEDYAVTISPVVDKIGVFRNGRHFLDNNNNGAWDGPAGQDQTLQLGGTGDVPIRGDFDGDGYDEIGVYRGGERDSRFYLDSNGNGRWDGTQPGGDTIILYGASGDIPVIGDWNGDGVDDIGVFRPSTATFYLDSNGSGLWDGPAHDQVVRFGAAGDIPVIGDWNGDGMDDIGVVRNGVFYRDINGNGHWDGTVVDAANPFGAADDKPLTGDWNGDGRDDLGVHRSSNGTIYRDTNGNGRWDSTDSAAPFGAATDIAVAGKWIDVGVAQDSVKAPSDSLQEVCAPVVVPGDESGISTGRSDVDDALRNMIEATREDLSERLGVSVEAIQFDAAERVVWGPDLGFPELRREIELAYVISGFRIKLSYEGLQYTYHTSYQGFKLSNLIAQVPEEFVVSQTEGLSKAISDAREDLADRISVDADSLKLASVKQVKWNSGYQVTFSIGRIPFGNYEFTYQTLGDKAVFWHGPDFASRPSDYIDLGLILSDEEVIALTSHNDSNTDRPAFLDDAASRLPTEGDLALLLLR